MVHVLPWQGRTLTGAGEASFTHPHDYPILPKQFRILERGGRTMAAVMMPYPTLDNGAKCVGNEAFMDGLAYASRDTINTMKAVCASCPLLTSCREWGIAHERALMFGGLLPGERAAIRKERGQIRVEPSAAHEYGMNDEFFQHRGGQMQSDSEPVNVLAVDLPWVEPAYA